MCVSVIEHVYVYINIYVGVFRHLCLYVLHVYLCLCFEFLCVII